MGGGLYPLHQAGNIGGILFGNIAVGHDAQEHDRAGNPYRQPGAFKVTVDEQQVGQCDVAADTRLGHYSDLRVPLPATLGSEKKEVWVTLASDLEIPNVAAGLYEARILRRE